MSNLYVVGCNQYTYRYKIMLRKMWLIQMCVIEGGHKLIVWSLVQTLMILNIFFDQDSVGILIYTYNRIITKVFLLGSKINYTRAFLRFLVLDTISFLGKTLSQVKEHCHCVQVWWVHYTEENYENGPSSYHQGKLEFKITKQDNVTHLTYMLITGYLNCFHHVNVNLTLSWENWIIIVTPNFSYNIYDHEFFLSRWTS